MGAFDQSITARLSFSVLVVLFFFSYIYSTVVFVVVLPWLEHSVPGVMHLSSFTIITCLAMASYIACVFRNPGSVPTDWAPDEGKISTVLEVKRKGAGSTRYCNKCCKPKPPRCHHCRVCNRCVLRMDHHCVWINNCVGHRNYKSFFLFLFYATVACIHALTLVVMQMSVEVKDHRYEHILERPWKLVKPIVKAGRALSPPPPLNPLVTPLVCVILKVVCAALCVMLIVGIGLLLSWHTYLIFNNKTTIEYHEGVRARVQTQIHQHPYDLGLCGNLHAVLGPHVPTWLAPTECAVAGDGFEYEMSESVVLGMGGGRSSVIV
mmetsp:Transcript_28588/g.34720  ORF Transcript_28588/g.34720 Transcript_28588/m.34720 type:complete len:321 (-) Transcript_28588:619-1581(-)